MKALKLSVALGLLFATSLALATPPKDTLTVERIVIINNGASSGKSITSHVLTKRFYTEDECNTEKGLYEAQKVLKIGPSALNAEVLTIAECDALDHRFEIQYQ